MTVSSTTTTIECAGQRHRVVWAGGELTLPDHVDPDGERTLAALGGTTCACVEVLDAWARHCDDPALLTALTRGTSETLHRPNRQGGASLTRAGRSGPPPTSVGPVATLRPVAAVGRPPAADQAAPPHDLEILYGLGPALGARLVAAVTEGCLGRVEAGDPATLPALRASLVGRAVLALTFWTEGALPIRVEVADPDQAPSLRREGDQLVAVLRLGWVAEIWGRGLATVANRFVIDGTDGQRRELLLSTVGPDFGPTETITVRFENS